MPLCLAFLRQSWWLGLWLGLACFGQTNEELFREYQFNFNLPGARANGMGGAFIGLSDDASASFTNPAGLAFLNETAITLEYRDRTLDALSGSFEGAITSEFEQQEATLAQATFFSLNFRLKSWYLGVFQYDYLNDTQERSFNSTSRDIFNRPRVEQRDIFLDLHGTARGVGVARRFGKWKVGVTFNELDITAETQYSRQSLTIDIPPTRTSYFSTIDDKDTAFGYSVGILHEPKENFSWGLVWRDNPKFSLTESARQLINQQPLFDLEFEIPFVAPDVLGAGVRWRVRPQLSILADWQRIFYSQIIKDGFFIVEGRNTDSEDNYTISDTNEIHIGSEWLIPGKNNVWALRAGFFRNPRHAVNYIGDDPAIVDRFRGTGLKDENHFTAGFGWVFKNTIELDISANFWSQGQEFTASVIWRKK